MPAGGQALVDHGMIQRDLEPADAVIKSPEDCEYRWPWARPPGRGSIHKHAVDGLGPAPVPAARRGPPAWPARHIHGGLGVLVLQQPRAHVVGQRRIVGGDGQVLAARRGRGWPCSMMPTMTRETAGRPMVDIRKARPRICSRYSRLAIRSMLRIGLASHGLDKDLFKRRLDQLEAVDGGHGGGLMQQLLRVAVWLEPDLGVAGEVLRLGDFFAVQEMRRCLRTPRSRGCAHSWP